MVSSSAEKQRMYTKRWIETHPEEWTEINRANAKRYYEKNREKILIKCKERKEKRMQMAKQIAKQESEGETDSEVLSE